MSEAFSTYGITTGVFAIFTGILFEVRTRRIYHLIQRSREEEKQIS
jgi:hypothetical protein